MGRVDLTGDVQIGCFRVKDSRGKRLELAETVYECETREEPATANVP